MLSSGRQKSRYHPRPTESSKESFKVLVDEDDDDDDDDDNNNNNDANNNNNNNNNEESVNDEEAIQSESLQPSVCLRVPEMKNELSYWQIGTSPVTRLKINTLRADVKIRTEEAGVIGGMLTDFSRNVSTLGTAIITIFNKPVKVHVTRSKYTAPIVCDGTLGYEFSRGMKLEPMSRRKCALFGIPASVPILMGEELIPDYKLKLRKGVKEARIAREKGSWAGVPTENKLSELRKFVPVEVADDDRVSVIETLEEYADCFYLPGEKLAPTKLLKYKIKSRTEKVINVPQIESDCSEDEWNEIEARVGSLLRDGIVQASDSPYNSPIRLIERRPDSRGNARYCLSPDYRELNKNSEGDAFPIPDVIELTDLLHGSKYFSVFDLASACYQIELDPEDREKTAFSTRTKRYEFLRMPLGIKNASQSIQRLLNSVVDEMLYAPSIAFVSYDDIIVYAPTIEEHQVRVRKLLSRIQDAGLKLQPSKCQLFSNDVRYLSFSVTDRGLRPDPEKIQRIRSYESPPETGRCLSRFLGLLSSYKRFVPNHAERIKPMSNLFKNNKDRSDTLVWTSEALDSFNDMKRAFAQELVLSYPNWKEPFILETDASDVAVQCALLQNDPESGKIVAIAYASRCYAPGELDYSKYNRARLAAMYGMDTWYWYLNGGDPSHKFTLRTPSPRAFDWYIKRRFHNSDVLRRFEMSYSGKEFTIETLRRGDPPSSQ